MVVLESLQQVSFVNSKISVYQFNQNNLKQPNVLILLISTIINFVNNLQT